MSWHHPDLYFFLFLLAVLAGLAAFVIYELFGHRRKPLVVEPSPPKHLDYITVKRKTLEALISFGSMCLVRPASGWTVDPNALLARTLQRMRAEITAKKMEGRDCITVNRKPLEELMSAASMKDRWRIFSWFFGPQVQLKGALKRMQAEIARVDGGETGPKHLKNAKPLDGLQRFVR
jgi:hypothetical protein